jgi:outer membrane lipoprotein-sorting protein
MTLAVERATYRLLGLSLLDDQGGVKSYRFSNLKENQGLPDSVFTFRVPKGVEVQR